MRKSSFFRFPTGAKALHPLVSVAICPSFYARLRLDDIQNFVLVIYKFFEFDTMLRIEPERALARGVHFSIRKMRRFPYGD